VTEGSLSFDLYVWSSPRELDVARAEALLRDWHGAGGDPSQSPFDPSTDVGWFHRELMAEATDIVVSSDALPNPDAGPILLAPKDERPARLVAIRLPPAAQVAVPDSILGLAAKYDLVLFDARSRSLHRPLEEMAAYASATFWPSGAIQAGVAGIVGGAVALIAWVLAIPVLSGILILAGAFMFVMAVYTFIHEGQRAMKARRS
jgi:hypothetical protein